MTNVLISLDPLQLMALEKMATKYRLSRTAIIRNLIYTGTWNEHRGQPGAFRPAPKVGTMGQHAQRGRFVQVDEHGLSTEADELEREANSPVGDANARPASVSAAALRVFHPLGDIQINGHRMMCGFVWTQEEADCNCKEEKNIKKTS